MTTAVEPVAVTGTWVRHVAAGDDPLGRGRVPRAARWQTADAPALYLASDAETAWAEWYRYLAEEQIAPMGALPRDLWRFGVTLGNVADLSSDERLAAIGLEPPQPDREQWQAYQSVGARLLAAGMHGVLWRSAARPAGRALCVFLSAAPLAAVRPIHPPEQHREPPAPPRGLRT